MMTGLGRQRSAGAATAASEKKPRVANQSALSARGELGSRRANEIVRVSVRDRARGAPESAADTAGNEEDSVESPGGFAPRPPAASRTTEAPARSRTSALAPRVDATMAARTSVTVAATSALHAPRVRATARARRPIRTPPSAERREPTARRASRASRPRPDAPDPVALTHAPPPSSSSVLDPRARRALARRARLPAARARRRAPPARVVRRDARRARGGRREPVPRRRRARGRRRGRGHRRARPPRPRRRVSRVQRGEGRRIGRGGRRRPAAHVQDDGCEKLSKESHHRGRAAEEEQQAEAPETEEPVSERVGSNRERRKTEARDGDARAPRRPGRDASRTERRRRVRFVFFVATIKKKSVPYQYARAHVFQNRPSRPRRTNARERASSRSNTIHSLLLHGARVGHPSFAPSL